jgi:hypothetical protein
VTDSRIPGFHVPQHWAAKPALGAKTLTLEETLVIRRRLTGMTNAEIGEDMGRGGTWVNKRIQAARTRWGAGSVAEFLAMPELRDAVREDR